MGAFGEALNATAQKKSLGSEDLSKWSSALTQAANVVGWEAKNYRNEAELVTKIVENVLTRLDYKPFILTEFPVGLESRVQEVIKYIETTKDSCVIGIWGMGGSGKTTLAKAIYNQIHCRFTHKSFIENIRETDKRERGRAHLQKIFLKQILKTKLEIYSTSWGKTMIENIVAGKNALIILDDVNEFEQLKALCGETQWIGKGNVVIITTRNLRLLHEIEVDYKYEMKEMDKNESLELFSLHAFGEAKPREGFIELAEKVVAYCDGLPLALKVLGSNLSKRATNLWESEWSKLQMIPNAEVQQSLRISYDLRDQTEKDIFLDVCCAFIGRDKGCVTEVLNGCRVNGRRLYADIGITDLIEHNLIKVEKNNKLRMHHLLREMGREIISEDSIKPGEHSRLWFQQDVLNVLTTNTGTEAIQGLSLKLHLTNKECFEAYAFQEMKELRLLQLDHVQLSGDYGYLSKQLRWVCWHGFPSKYIPNKFNLEGVIAIDLKHSNLKPVWKKPQALEQLKILNLSHSKYLIETPDFSGLTSLEKLILKYCPSLCKVHQSIGDLRKVLLINLKNCTSLTNLPIEIYKLKSLETLILSGCSKIDKLEENIMQMESLTTLIAENTALKQVPFSLVSSKIGYLFLCGYKGLSYNVFPSIIWSWMSPAMGPLSRIRPICGISSSLVSMSIQNNDLGDLAPILCGLLNLRSVLVQHDIEFQISKQVKTILDEVRGVHFTELGITPSASAISKHSLSSYMLRIGSYKDEVFSILSKRIFEGLTTNETCYVFLPTDHYPYWFAYKDEGHSMCFTMPKDCRLKGMTLCAVYLSTPEIVATEYLTSVLMVNYTKCIIQIYKRDTVTSFNNIDWQRIISHLCPGDKVGIFVTYRHRLMVKKTTVYLLYDKSNDMEIQLASKPPIEKVYSRRRKRGDIPESQLEQDKTFLIGPKELRTS